ncbi:MAG: hypothetical protein HDT26_13585 [Subdoligranulum sp.]|nr:hypothetical protein [Subdoligranulum sp.]
MDMKISAFQAVADSGSTNGRAADQGENKIILQLRKIQKDGGNQQQGAADHQGGGKGALFRPQLINGSKQR